MIDPFTISYDQPVRTDLPHGVVQIIRVSEHRWACEKRSDDSWWPLVRIYFDEDAEEDAWSFEPETDVNVDMDEDLRWSSWADMLDVVDGLSAPAYPS